MAKHVVATVDEIPPGQRKVVEVAGRSIGVFNVNGSFYALRNSCPHQGGPLCWGRLTGFLEARVPGEYHYSRRGEILRCPWHGWEFDIFTGQSWVDPARVRVRTYPVTVASAEEASQDSPVCGGQGGVDTVTGEAADTDKDSAASPVTDAQVQHSELGEGRQKGSYVAETYPVTVERRLVLVEVP